MQRSQIKSLAVIEAGTTRVPLSRQAPTGIKIRETDTWRLYAVWERIAYPSLRDSMLEMANALFYSCTQ